MNTEEARKFQDEWLAAQPKWGAPREDPLPIRLANEAFAALPEEEQRRRIGENLKLTVQERFDRHQQRLEILIAHADELRRPEDVEELFRNMA